jgi:hypothetical protein
MAIFVPNPEELGRRRFPDNKSFRKQLNDLSNDILGQIQQTLLPSNYPDSTSTNLGIFNKIMSREVARLRLGMDAISNDGQYTLTRPQFLQEVLGERLLLGKNIAPANYNDQSYRNYLISIKNADLAGSKKKNIEALASEFTGQQINIKELYLEARQPNSSLDVSDTHKMIVEVLIDMLQPGQDINSLASTLNFFVNLVRPAHVLYDTKFIWTEQIDVNKIFNVLFGDTGGGCVPDYDFLITDDEPAYLAEQIFILAGPVDSNGNPATGHIDSIHHDNLTFYFDNSTRVITDPSPNGTTIFDVNGRQVTFNALQIGQYVRMNYQIIPGSFQFWNTPTILLPTPTSQYYKSVYQRPLFQESVKKIMDANGRFPLQTKTTRTTICDRWVQDALMPMYEDLRGNCNNGFDSSANFSQTLRKYRGFPELYYPYPEESIHDPALLGSDYVQFMSQMPLTDGSSHPATISDVQLQIDGTLLTNPFLSVDASHGRIQLQTDDSYWDNTSGIGRFPIDGDDLLFTYHYLDGTNNTDGSTETVFGISYWQLPQVPAVKADGSGTLADSSDITVEVDGTVISNVVKNLDPLLGHVILNASADFWRSSAIGRLPVADSSGVPGDIFSFSYTLGNKYEYGLLFDDPSRYMDSYLGSDPYEMVFDSSSNSNAVPQDQPLVIGYRYRAYLLHHSSVLNSPDTLNLNEYQKPATRASIANQEAVLNHYNPFYSGEFLTDPNPLPNIPSLLGDPYLSNGLDPILKLNAGTPTFQQTFSYQPNLIYQKKLQDVRKNHRLLLYSDLLLKEFQTGNAQINLNTICDSDRVTFKTRIKEDLTHIKECSPWELFDTVETMNVDVSIPGDTRGVPNLRVDSTNLRQNFILRDVEDTGTATFSYSFVITPDTPITADSTTFQLPSFFKYTFNDELIDFPALPVVNVNGGPPVINTDITCLVNGAPHAITALNPTTGVVTIAPFDTELVTIQQVTLTQADIDAGEITVPGFIVDPNLVTVTVIHGTSQYIDQDFFTFNDHIIWRLGPLQGILEAGDILRISYEVIPYEVLPDFPFLGIQIEFTYHIINHTIITLIDRDNSRIMDDKYVFPSLCPDIEDVRLAWVMSEYYTYLDDYSDGIKLSFFNIDTLQVEDHIFSGPVFELYDASQDQIGVPENIPNALVRIPNPLSLTNPLSFSADYSFLTDALVRFRKKTFKELLPSRSFRTIELTEVLPV